MNYLSCPAHECDLVRFDQGGDGNPKLVAPRIAFFNLNIRWETRVFYCFLLFSGLLFRLPTRILFPVSTIFGEEGLQIDMLT